MKAVIITFNGEYAKTGKDEIARNIANSISNYTELDGYVNISFMEDDEVYKALLKSTTNKEPSKSKKQAQLNKELEDYCIFISNTFAINIDSFKKNFYLNFIVKKEFRNPKIVSYLAKENLTEEQKSILAQYGLEKLPEYIKEINKTFNYF